MSGWMGVLLCLGGALVVMVFDPLQSTAVVVGWPPALANASLLLSIAALASMLGLLSPPWALARQAALWSAAALAVITVGVNIDDVVVSFLARDRLGAVNEAAPAGAPLRAAAMVEIKANKRGHFFTRAEINNTAIDTMVDTGASLIALSYEDAERVGLHPFTLRFTVPVNTANGVARAAPVKLRRVEIGNVRVHDVAAVVMPRGAMRGTLLGMSFLSRLRRFSVEDGRLNLED